LVLGNSKQNWLGKDFLWVSDLCHFINSLLFYNFSILLSVLASLYNLIIIFSFHPSHIFYGILPIIL